MVLVQYSSYEMVFCGILGRKNMWYLVVFQRQTFGIPKKKVSGNPVHCSLYKVERVTSRVN